MTVKRDHQSGRLYEEVFQVEKDDEWVDVGDEYMFMNQPLTSNFRMVRRYKEEHARALGIKPTSLAEDELDIQLPREAVEWLYRLLAGSRVIKRPRISGTPMLPNPRKDLRIGDLVLERLRRVL